MNLNTAAYELLKEYQNIQWIYKVKLPNVNIEIIDGYSKWGFYNPSKNLIGISSILVVNYPWYIVKEILKHEMAHLIAYQILNSKDEVAHGPSYQRACDMICVAKWARRAITSIDKFMEEDTLTKEQHKVLERAEKLQALCNSDNIHEAALALDRLKALQDKHNLDAVKKQALNIDFFVYSFGKVRRPSWSIALVNLINKTYNTRAIFGKQYDVKANRELRYVELFGEIQSLKLAEYTMNYIIRAAERAYEKYNGPKNIRARNSFIASFIKGCGENMKPQEPENKETNSTDLVVTDVNSLIVKEAESYMRRRHPRTVSIQSETRQDYRAAEQGFNAGKNTNINKAMTNSKGQLMIGG